MILDLKSNKKERPTSRGKITSVIVIERFWIRVAAWDPFALPIRCRVVGCLELPEAVDLVAVIGTPKDVGTPCVEGTPKVVLWYCEMGGIPITCEVGGCVVKGGGAATV